MRGGRGTGPETAMEERMWVSCKLENLRCWGRTLYVCLSVAMARAAQGSLRLESGSGRERRQTTRANANTANANAGRPSGHRLIT